MKKRNLFSIENKILIPFVSITLVAIAGLFAVFYQMEYKIKLESEGVNAQALVAYINADSKKLTAGSEAEEAPAQDEAPSEAE